MTLALLMILAQTSYPANPTVKQGISRDGGISWPVEIVGGGGTTADSALATELRDGTVGVRVTNMPPVPARNPLTGAAKVDGSGVVQPVSVVALPLPTGAATDAQLTQLLAAALAIVANQTNGSGTVRVANQPAAPKRNLSGAAVVDGSGAVQPVSATSLPLPTGAAQEAGGNLDAILRAVVAIPSTPLTFTQMPLNPFIPRCNPVRRTGCQP